MKSDEPGVLTDSVGPRLRAVRKRRQMSLESVSALIGVSASTLSRLESGKRRATLEVLISLARTYGTTLDELATDEHLGDPRLNLRSVAHGPMAVLPLSRHAGGVNAFKVVLRPGHAEPSPEHRSHEGWQWLVVLEGRLRVTVHFREVELGPGEAAEFDTHLPHHFEAATSRPVEYLVLFGAQGEKVSLRMTTRPQASTPFPDQRD
ncbi:helix-turn-helix domain-containing protein [Kineosporia mesophila]|uniref:helix-turn-helix domain-containing protein n=1 Tax=Kineosporia mesophila TaxID=566012 RepID=UPI001E3DBA1F|nr:XRE family transcriptional regulator [Kineosporia mesophila]